MDLRIAGFADELMKVGVSLPWVLRMARKGTSKRLAKGGEGMASLQRSQRRLLSRGRKAAMGGNMSAADKADMARLQALRGLTSNREALSLVRSGIPI